MLGNCLHPGSNKKVSSGANPSGFCYLPFGAVSKWLYFPYLLYNEWFGIKYKRFWQFGRDCMMFGPAYQYKSFVPWKLCFLQFLHFPFTWRRGEKATRTSTGFAPELPRIPKSLFYSTEAVTLQSWSALCNFNVQASHPEIMHFFRTCCNRHCFQHISS